jgi:hypothetical protein
MKRVPKHILRLPLEKRAEMAFKEPVEEVIDGLDVRVSRNDDCLVHLLLGLRLSRKHCARRKQILQAFVRTLSRYSAA